jgi:phage/plasmid-associated DNA primase
MSCDITTITRKRGVSNQASPDKVRMKGRRCGVFQETDDGEKINVGIMKEFTGGDKILVRDLYQGSKKMVQFKPQIKLFLTCNQLPNVPSNDDGTWRRLRVIEFCSKFTYNPDPEKSNEFLIDTNLKKNIESWAPTFLSLLLNVYKEYKSVNYLEDPKEVQASTNQYKRDNDYYADFVHAKLIITDNPSNKLSIDFVLNEFKLWYKFLGEQHMTIPKKTEFEKHMTKFLGPSINDNFIKVVLAVKISSDNVLDE